MAEHFTRNTIEAEAWCAVCERRTMHRVDDRRAGPCLNCIARREQQHQDAAARAAEPQKPSQQRKLFDDAT